jgi:hypothetical protein
LLLFNDTLFLSYREAFLWWGGNITVTQKQELTTDKSQMRLSQNFSFWESNLEIRGFARLKA